MTKWSKTDRRVIRKVVRKAANCTEDERYNKVQEVLAKEGTLVTSRVGLLTQLRNCKAWTFEFDSETNTESTSTLGSLEVQRQIRDGDIPHLSSPNLRSPDLRSPNLRGMAGNEVEQTLELIDQEATRKREIITSAERKLNSSQSAVINLENQIGALQTQLKDAKLVANRDRDELQNVIEAVRKTIGKPSQN